MPAPRTRAGGGPRAGGAPGGTGGPGTSPGGRRGRGVPAGTREAPVEKKLHETVVRINRNAKVVKGGRRFTFSALVVVGDGRGKVGIGHGKANEVPRAVEKGVKDATKSMFPVAIVNGGTIAHEVVGKYRTSKVFMRPAAPGTGVIAGAAVKAVLVAVGLQNVLTKTYGSTNPVNVLKATETALRSLRTREEVRRLRGVEVNSYAWPKLEVVSGGAPAAAVDTTGGAGTR